MAPSEDIELFRYRAKFAAGDEVPAPQANICFSFCRLTLLRLHTLTIRHFISLKRTPHISSSQVAFSQRGDIHGTLQQNFENVAKKEITKTLSELNFMPYYLHCESSCSSRSDTWPEVCGLEYDVTYLTSLSQPQKCSSHEIRMQGVLDTERQVY
jgi:hypothetical protein